MISLFGHWKETDEQTCQRIYDEVLCKKSTKKSYKIKRRARSIVLIL